MSNIDHAEQFKFCSEHDAENNNNVNEQNMINAQENAEVERNEKMIIMIDS